MQDDGTAQSGATDDDPKPAGDTPAPEGGTTDDAPPPTQEDKAVAAMQRRIDQITREKHDARREADAAKKELDVLKAMRDGAQPDKPTAAPPDIDKLVEERAAQRMREVQFNTECNATYHHGVEAFPDFKDAVGRMTNMFGDRVTREFLDGINALPNGHEVYHRLAHDVDEAERVLALAPMKMAVELAKLSTAKPKPVSGAPAPVQPVGSRGRSREWNLDDADIPMAEFVRLREKQQSEGRRR